MLAEVDVAMASGTQGLRICYRVMPPASKRYYMVNLKVRRTIACSKERSGLAATFTPTIGPFQDFDDHVGVSEKGGGLNLNLTRLMVGGFEPPPPCVLRQCTRLADSGLQQCFKLLSRFGERE